MATTIAQLQNIFKDTEGKWWIESGDDLDENDHEVPNDYHGSFDTLVEAEKYVNKHFDYPSSYFVDRSGVRLNPFSESVQNEDPQDRAGCKEINNHAVRPMHAAPALYKPSTVIETREPKMYYIQDGNTLYSLKPNEFRAVQDNRGCIVGYRTLKHLPTSVTRYGDTLVSTDQRRPMYYYEENILRRR